MNDECSDNISLLLENNPLYCDCNMQQVRDQHEMIFGDLEITQCVNQDITVYEFHDELCCDINNIDWKNFSNEYWFEDAVNQSER